VLLPITVAEAGAYAVVVDVFELVSLVAAVLLLEPLLLLELLPQAATTSPAATITAAADSREQLRSMRPSLLLNCPGFPRAQCGVESDQSSATSRHPRNCSQAG